MAQIRLKEAWFDHGTDIPKWAKIGIAQIIVEWAVLERELEEVVRLVMDGEIQNVRILTGKMNARGRIEAAAYLIEAHIYEERVDKNILKRFHKLGKHIEENLQPLRDMVAHGLWGKFNNKWHVLKMRKRRKTPELGLKMDYVSRPVLPQREEMTLEKLHQAVLQIVEGTKSIEAFCEDWKSLLPPSQYKSPVYSRRKAHYPPPRRKKV